MSATLALPRHTDASRFIHGVDCHMSATLALPRHTDEVLRLAAGPAVARACARVRSTAILVHYNYYL